MIIGIDLGTYVSRTEPWAYMAYAIRQLQKNGYQNKNKSVTNPIHLSLSGVFADQNSTYRNMIPA